MYTGDKPCPGCKRKGSEESRTRADELCWLCKKALRIGAEIIKNPSEDRYAKIQYPWYTLKELTLYLYNGDEKIMEQVDRIERIPYLSENTEGEGNSAQFTEDFKALVRSMKVVPTNEVGEVVKLYSNEAKESVMVPLSQGKALFRFMKSLSRFVNSVHAESYADMRRWLHRLNDGNVTLEDFESYANTNIKRG